ncbi:MAG: YIP1 family protein [Pseudomonadota bacterium]|nr:YIP1 family protein [Pseudomonadota bacterium]
MSSEEPVRPLHDVWLRPRRVFRELASRPIGTADYLLGAAQGIAGWLALSRAQNAGASSGVAEIFGKALVIGSVAGIASLFLMGAVYARLGARTAKPAARNRVFHVLAYGGVPLAASLAAWVLAALLAGRAAFEAVPHPDVEEFVALLLGVQFIAYVLLTVWSVVIQVMGLSEILGLTTRKAFALWVLGQVVGFLALVFLMVLIASLFPNVVTG